MLMARIQSRDLRLELERRPLAELVDVAMRRLGALTAKHPVAIEVPRDLPLVNVEPELIERVFTSLVGNVVKHTPAGTHLTISARVAGDFVEASVEDDGPGLPEGRDDEVFESFSRGERPGARRGAGLGLAISRAIVEAHGGTIRSERRAEKGARFVFTLPLRRSHG
jgi:two-component system sensor histidine kinase KdpD